MPIEKKELDDQTIQDILDKKDSDAKDQKTEPPAIDKDAHEKAVKAEKNLNTLLEKHGFESTEDLVDALESNSALAKKLGDRDLDAIIKAADTLEGYEAIWAAEETKRQKEDETDDDRFSRLEKELQDLKDEKVRERDQEKATRESQEALEAHEAAVTAISREQDISEGQIPFFKEFMGVNNPILDVDLDNKAAVRKMLKDQSKKYNDFVTGIIKGYTEGKIKLADVPAVEPPGPEKKEAKNLKEARGMAKERLLGLFKNK